MTLPSGSGTLKNPGKMRKLPQHGGIATGVAFTPDGRHARRD